MSDPLFCSIFTSISESLNLIRTRFSKISAFSDFIDTPQGMLILDSLSMRLQVIGELLKKAAKHDKKIFGKYPGIEWNKVIQLRDLISHHYDLLDHEIIYDICKNHVPGLEKQ